MKLSVGQVDFNYKCFPVLRDITFQAEAGNLICVLGSNGAGKSTLFKCILGILRPQAGTILMDGVNIVAMPPRLLASKAAYIPQSQPGHFSYSSLEIVLVGTTAGKGLFFSPGKKHEEQAAEALERLGISRLAYRNFSHLSGGERQMVLIARALAQQAKMLIMDEPCSGLDYGNQIRVMECVKELSKQGYLILLSTHSPEQAFLYSDAALVLAHGRLRCYGTPEETLNDDLFEEIYGVRVNLRFDAGKKCIWRAL